MGLTMISALNLFLQQVVDERALPFIIEAPDPFLMMLIRDNCK